jgi:hypothetical protein
VFRDAQNFKTNATGPAYSVTFVDPSFETSTVFQEFLELIVEIPTARRLGRSDAEDFAIHVGLFRFLKKWDCPSHSSLLVFTLIHLARGNDCWARIIFAIGACLDNHALAQDALGQHLILGGRHKVWDPLLWKAWLWQSVPPQYLAPLVRAWCRREDDAFVLDLFNEEFSPFNQGT